MKRFLKSSVVVLVVVALMVVPMTMGVSAAKIITSPTGYTSASQVNYKTSGGTIANWGARGEDATFLSKYATAFYTGSDTYDALSQKKGGTNTQDAYKSDLYLALKELMVSNHSHETSYSETKNLYKYTDCLKNDTAHISSFYSGKELSGSWGSGWNREHTWPNSKGLGGNDENDIMMLRPTWESENSSRGNTAYGESSGYYDPGEGLRGDCARICLYVYVRWGNTSRMWNKNGVIEGLDILLKWMQEDPVDTWEMGRNDAVESITGTRNVFVDYPEFAWQLFGRQMPSDLVTPSGKGADAPPVISPDDCTHTFGEWVITTPNTDTTPGMKEHICTICGKKEAKTMAAKNNCTHMDAEIVVIREATTQKSGMEEVDCPDCGYHGIHTTPPLKGSADATGAGCQGDATAAVILVSATALAFVTIKRWIFTL